MSAPQAESKRLSILEVVEPGTTVVDAVKRIRAHSTKERDRVLCVPMTSDVGVFVTIVATDKEVQIGTGGKDIPGGSAVAEEVAAFIAAAKDAIFHGMRAAADGRAPRVVCSQCMSDVACVRVCGNCKLARYCSVECQRTAWPRHKTVCPKKAK